MAVFITLPFFSRVLHSGFRVVYNHTVQLKTTVCLGVSLKNFQTVQTCHCVKFVMIQWVNIAYPPLWRFRKLCYTHAWGGWGWVTLCSVHCAVRVLVLLHPTEVLCSKQGSDVSNRECCKQYSSWDWCFLLKVCCFVTLCERTWQTQGASKLNPNEASPAAANADQLFKLTLLFLVASSSCPYHFPNLLFTKSFSKQLLKRESSTR